MPDVADFSFNFRYDNQKESYGCFSGKHLVLRCCRAIQERHDIGNDQNIDPDVAVQHNATAE